jgi:hypothetical protein
MEGAMAQFRATTQAKPIEIDKFLGLNTSLSETELKLGECTYMRNFRITNNYKVEKRIGHTTFKDFSNAKPCYGVWSGILGAKSVILTVNDAKLREYNVGTATWSDVGAITDAPTTMLYFDGKVYIRNGTDYKEYDGTTYQDVSAYVPTIAIGAPPAGGGTLFEEINLLTGAKWQAFVGDGTAAYQLAETSIDADLVQATVNGVAKAETTDFTVVRATGIVTFSVAPLAGDDVKIRWVKASTANPTLIKGHKYQIKFGVSNDTNVFIWGNTTEKNVYRVSGTLKPNYFPVNSLYKVSDSEYAVTDIQPQYNRIIIFKENRTHYSYPQYNELYDTNAGLNKYIYPAFDLNEAVGNQAFNACQLIENNPVSFMSDSVWLWSNTQVEDERNAKIISSRIKEHLNEIDLTTAVTFDNQVDTELWINVGSIVYIYNYGTDTWYEYDNVKGYWFDRIGDYIYYGTDGKVERFDALNDNSVAITAKIKTGFIDFGAYEYRKNSRDMWVSIRPASRTRFKLKCPTNKKNEDDPSVKVFEEGYKLFDFEALDFEDFSFETNRNPQPFRLKIKAKKYAYIQFIIWNDADDETLLINGFKVTVETNSFSK